MRFEKESTMENVTYTAEQQKLWNQALAEIKALEEPEQPVPPDPDEMQEAADAWLNGILVGKPAPLNWTTRWALGSDDEEEEGGIQDRAVPKHIAEAFAISRYGDLIAGL
jgi:hypothetical protein